MTLKQIQKLITASKLDYILLLGAWFEIFVKYDLKAYPHMKSSSRIYLQVGYGAKCSKTGKFQHWVGRKWYLSSHMTEDEIIKTAFIAFKTAVEHEVMENFKINGKTLFNPHVDYKELIRISDKEVHRKEKKNGKTDPSIAVLQRRVKRQSVSGGLRKR